MKSWLVCYDIEDDRERSRVAKALEGYGQRVQYSVFELHLTGDEVMIALRDELVAILGDHCDDVRFYRLTLDGIRDSRNLNGQPIALPLSAVVI